MRREGRGVSGILHCLSSSEGGGRRSTNVFANYRHHFYIYCLRVQQELTFHIKQSLSRLNAQILALQQHVRATAAKGNRSTRQMDEHSGNVVIILQSKLANTSMGFKEALEIRTEVKTKNDKTERRVLEWSYFSLLLEVTI